MDPKWAPDLQFASKLDTQKNSKKQAAAKSSTLPKWSQIGDPGGHQSSTKLKLFRNFLHPGPQMGQESSRGLKRLAQGVQKVPKGFQKVAKSHEKDIQKASTRHPNAISKCIGNSIGNSISNAIANAIATATGYRSPLRSMKTNTRTGWLGGTDNSSRSDFFLEINLLLYTKYYTRCQARWREGRRQVDTYIYVSF